MTYEEAEALIREHMDYGGNVKVAALAKALSTSTLTFHEAAVAALEAATKSLNAAGASEGQADWLQRAVWEVERPEHDGFYWLWRISYKGERMPAEIVQLHQGSFLFPGDSKAFKPNSTVFVGAYWLPAYIAPQPDVSAEIAALRERIAGMEKDAQRYRWLRQQRFEFNHSRITPVRPDKLDTMIDAAIERDKK